MPASTLPPSSGGTGTTALAADVSGWYRGAVKALLRVAPWFPLRRKAAVHTRDPERAALFAQDPLTHRHATPLALATTVAAMESLRAEPEAVKVPLLVLLGESDTVVDDLQRQYLPVEFQSLRY